MGVVDGGGTMAEFARRQGWDFACLTAGTAAKSIINQMHKNVRLALIMTACLLGCIVSQRNAIHTETNAPSPDGKDNSFGITNGMSRNVAETLLPAFTNRCDGFVDPGGIVSEYWTKDGRRISVIYDWTGSSSADAKTSWSNRVEQLPLFIEPDNQVKNSTNHTLATSLFSAERQPTSPPMHMEQLQRSCAPTFPSSTLVIQMRW